MRKTLKTLAISGSLLALAATANAANVVSIGQTSPGFVRQECEQLGSITATWDSGSELTAGDWFYMDLPIGASICKKIDYVIAGAVNDGGNNPNGNVTIWSGNQTNAVFAGGVMGIPGIAADVANGPLTLNDTGACAPLDVTTYGGQVAIRVSANTTERRVWFRVVGNTPGAAVAVPNDETLTVRFLDGNRYAGTAAAGTVGILLNDDGDLTTEYGTKSVDPTTIGAAADMFGDSDTDLIDFEGGGVSEPTITPFVENTLCANVEETTGEWLLTNYDSSSDIFTFEGEFKIAHLVSAISITLESCNTKNSTAPLNGNIIMPGEQETGCKFNYEDDAGYCTGAAEPFSGNRILIHGSSNFGEPGDRYDVHVESDTSGVYFGNVPAIYAYSYTDADTACDYAGTNKTPLSFGVKTSANAAAAINTGDCNVLTSQRGVRASSGNSGTVTNIDTYNTLWIDLNQMVYDTGIVGAGIEADVTVFLDKYPCGNIFDATRTLGTFVSTCPTLAAAGTTTLLYPFMPPLDGSAAPWWGGFTVVNAGTADGTCVLTVWEEDGDSGTMTTPTIAAGTQWNPYGLTNVLAGLTASANNTGTLGDSNCAIRAACAFNLGAGFAFTGTGNEGTGYTAYILGAAGWDIN